MVSAAMSREGSVAASVQAPPASSWSARLLASLGAQDTPSPQQASDHQQLAARPWPSRREERWRFTDLAPLEAIAPRRLIVEAGSPSRADLPSPSAVPVLRLLLDGVSDPLQGITLPAGLTSIPEQELTALLGSVLQETGCADHWPVLLNGAMAPRVLALRARGSVAPVLELVSEAGRGEGVLPLRILLILEPGASLQLLQVHRSEGPNLTSVLLEARLGNAAQLHQGMVAEGSAGSVLLHHLAVAQAQGSELRQTCLSSGWALARTEPRILQTEGMASTRLRGLQLVRDQQIADTHSLVRFAGPEGRLDQLHKTVADGAGRSVFDGAVQVPRQAQRTQAVQMSRNLLLSPRARIDTKPQLEIVADDVKCAHGATVTRLREDELFYLQSRGIAAPQAARLLLRGFCEEVLAELPAPARGWRPLGPWTDQEVARP